MHSLVHDYPVTWLAALPQHRRLIRAVSVGRSRMREAIVAHPYVLLPDALSDRARQIVLPNYIERLTGLVRSFGVAAIYRF